VQRVVDRLCAWESDLVMEAKAINARSVSCWGRHLVPVTDSNEQPGRTVRWWCA
jgi:hypothetical protein